MRPHRSFPGDQVPSCLLDGREREQLAIFAYLAVIMEDTSDAIEKPDRPGGYSESRDRIHWGKPQGDGIEME